MGGEAGLRIAYSNQKINYPKLFNKQTFTVLYVFGYKQIFLEVLFDSFTLKRVPEDKVIEDKRMEAKKGVNLC